MKNIGRETSSTLVTIQAASIRVREQMVCIVQATVSDTDITDASHIQHCFRSVVLDNHAPQVPQIVFRFDHRRRPDLFHALFFLRSNITINA